MLEVHERRNRTSRDCTIIDTPTVRMVRLMVAGRYTVEPSVRETLQTWEGPPIVREPQRTVPYA